jgi:hypothetical protein
MAAKRRQYTGELAKPIIWPDHPAFWGAATDRRVEAFRRKYERHQQKAEDRVQRKLSRKMRLLIRHYGIEDETNAAALAWALAFEHVPGFKVIYPEAKSKRGRKLKWDAGRLEDLYETVQAIKHRHRLSDRQALTFMVNNRQHKSTWDVPAGHRGSKQQWIETLESRLQHAKIIRKRADQALREIEKIAQKFRK